ncbi:MAG: TraB/GumN family protein [Novosphingobium sp.]|nr:TraB/GumN family protein [Novosphingobium sp.]
MKMTSRLCTLAFAALAACQSPADGKVVQTVESPEPPTVAEQPQIDKVEYGLPDKPATVAVTKVDPAQLVKPNKVEASKSNPTRVAHPALWKVADEDTTIYIFGTVHILPKGIDWFNGEVARAANSSQLLVTEITGGDPLTMQALVMDKAMLTDGKTLRSLLSDEQRASYEAALTALRVPHAAFDPFEPWYASVGLSTLPLMREGYAGENGVEKLLETWASERDIPQEGLETAEYQLSLFDSLPLEVQKNYLSQIVSELPNIKTQLAAMIEAWKSGDAEALAELMNSSQSDPVLIDRLLISRNKTWALWVDERLDEPGTVFLAVGAGHLAGEGSLQEQLAVAGIVSERIQ